LGFARPARRGAARAQPGRGQIRPAAPSSATPARRPSDALLEREAYCLGVLLRHPSMLFYVDRALQTAQLPRLSPQDFQATDHQLLMALIQNALEQDFAEPMHAVIAGLPLSLGELADQILAKTHNLDPNEDRVLEELLRTIFEIRRRHINQHIAHLRFLMQESQEQGALLDEEYQHIMVQHLLIRDRLDKALGKRYSRALLAG